MPEKFNPNQKDNSESKKEIDLSMDSFLDFSNMQTLYELVPELELSARENFSTLSLETQKNLIEEVQRRKNNGVKEWDIQYYVISTIKADMELESMNLADSDESKTLSDKNIN